MSNGGSASAESSLFACTQLETCLGWPLSLFHADAFYLAFLAPLEIPQCVQGFNHNQMVLIVYALPSRTRLEFQDTGPSGLRNE